VENLKELLNHPGWQDYLDLCEGAMRSLFMEMFQLDPTKPDNLIKFVELKSKIDAIRDMTYFIERQLAQGPEEVSNVDKSYGQRFFGLLKKIWR
jgi:hypothetical protein